MLQHLDDVPWADLEHAYGTASDVPGLLRRLLDANPNVRGETLHALHGNIFHQGTRYPATPHVIPFLIELCACPAISSRGDLLGLWGSLITGYFSVQERPCWGDGEFIYSCGEAQRSEEAEPYSAALHQIYRESLKGHGLLLDLLADEESGVRAGAAWVLACLPTMAQASLPRLEARLLVEASGSVRAALGFALGELDSPVPLRLMVSKDAFPAACCMAACQLARVEPTEILVEPLLRFISEPIEGYENIPGAGGKSTGDAAFSISQLSAESQRKAIPALCDRLDRSRSFDTMPLVHSLLCAAFPRGGKTLETLSAPQRQVLIRLVKNEELWWIGNLSWTFGDHGLPQDRSQCARLVGVKLVNYEALTELRLALAFAEIGFLEKARDGILKALTADPAVLERAPAPDESYLLCAKAFAESDPDRSIAAYRRALSINSGVAWQVKPTWRLADLIAENSPG